MTIRSVAFLCFFPLTVTLHAALPAIVGTWQLGNGAADQSAVLVFLDNGTYFHIQDGDDEPEGPDGIERGTYTWNQTTGALTVNVALDTNGEIGLSHPSGSYTITVAGDTLSIADQSGGAQLQRVFSATNASVGGWQFGNGADDHSGVLVFLPNGRYLFAEDGEDDPSGPDGMESGTFTWVEASGAFTGTPTLDTNGWLGFSDPVGNFSFKIAGDQGIFKDDEVTAPVKRVVNVPGGATIQNTGGTITVSFTGTLRESSDLQNWTDVMPRPTGSHTIVPSSGRRFFVARGR